MPVMSRHDVIELRDLPPNIRASTVPSELTITVGATMAEIERLVLQRYLAAYPTKKAAAEALGIGLRTLHVKVKRYRLDAPDGPSD